MGDDEVMTRAAPAQSASPASPMEHCVGRKQRQQVGLLLGLAWQADVMAGTQYRQCHLVATTVQPDQDGIILHTKDILTCTEPHAQSTALVVCCTIALGAITLTFSNTG
jgi:hypothetical protein